MMARSDRATLIIQPLQSALIICALALLPTGAHSQDVVKPSTGTTTTFQRLPAPKPTARQLPDGRIEVSWPAVEGAVRYDLVRSVPPAPQATIARPNPADTIYIDADVKPGSMYYYSVAAVTSAGTMGLRAATQPVTATAPITTTTTSTPAAPTERVDIRVDVASTSPLRYRLTFPSSSFPSTIQAIVYRASATDTTKFEPTSGVVQWSGTAGPNAVTLDYPVLTSAAYPRWVKFRRQVNSLFGLADAVSVSTPVLIPAATTTTGASSTPGTTSTTTATPPTPTGTVVGGSAVTVAAGATVAVASAAGAPGARWMSLNDSIATVDANGTVTGRTAGTTNVVAVTTAADGSLRVVAVPVTVP